MNLRDRLLVERLATLLGCPNSFSSWLRQNTERPTAGENVYELTVGRWLIAETGCRDLIVGGTRVCWWPESGRLPCTGGGLPLWAKLFNVLERESQRWGAPVGTERNARALVVARDAAARGVAMRTAETP